MKWIRAFGLVLLSLALTASPMNCGRSDSTGPTISNVAASGMTTSSVSITWSTNEGATSQVDYGTTVNYGSSSALDSNLVTTHTVNLTGLTAGSAYHFRVQSRDASNNLAVSADNFFTTSGPVQAWTTRFGGPAGKYDWATDSAIDGWGNVYVTGRSEGQTTACYDYVTIKYDSDGSQLWSARYDGPAGDSDEATAMAVDQWGNVYIAGYSRDQGVDSDMATIKYDSEGNQLWAARREASFLCETVDLVLNRSDGIYVTGTSKYDFCTIKYDGDGAEVWVALYDGPACGQDEAQAIATDGLGNVFVTGKSEGVGTGDDYATVKYDSDGRQAWVARHDGPASAGDDPVGICTDNSGNAYVTGTTIRSYSDTGGASVSYQANCETIKYDGEGNELWVGLGAYMGQPCALAVDGLGNAYVIAYTYGFGSYDHNATLVRFDASGGQLGDTTPCDIPVSDMALDNSGNLYVVGCTYANDASDQEMLLAKYNSYGSQLWLVHCPASCGKAIAIDGTGSICVVGSCAGNPVGDVDYFTAKYVQEQV